MGLKIEDYPIAKLKAVNDAMHQEFIRDLKELAVMYSNKRYVSREDEKALILLRIMADQIEVMRAIIDKQHSEIQFLITDHKQDRDQTNELLNLMERNYDLLKEKLIKLRTA